MQTDLPPISYPGTLEITIDDNIERLFRSGLVSRVKMMTDSNHHHQLSKRPQGTDRVHHSSPSS